MGEKAIFPCKSVIFRGDNREEKEGKGKEDEEIFSDMAGASQNLLHFGFKWKKGEEKGEIPTAGIRRGSEAQISLIFLPPGKGRRTEIEPVGRVGN